MNLLIPENLNIDALLHRYPPAEKLPHKERILVFIHIIYQTYVFDSGARTKNNYVYIQSSKLKALHKDYHRVLEWLKVAGIIEINHQYIKQIHPISYKLKDLYLQQEVRRVPLTDLRASKLFKQTANIDTSTKKKYPSLLSKFSPDNLNLTSESVKEQILSELKEDIKHDDINVAWRKYAEKVFSIQQINDGIYWFKQDDFGKRLHTNLTNLKKSLRENLKYQGKYSMGEIDIINSQPYFSISIIQKVYDNNKDVFIRFHQTNLKSMEQGLVGYRKLILTGKFYQYFENEIVKKHGSSYISKYVKRMLVLRDKVISGSSSKKLFGVKGFRPKYTSTSQWIAPDLRGKDNRAIIKTMIFQVLYGEHKLNTNEKKLFHAKFPLVWECLGIIKSEDPKGFVKSLQRAESDVILNIISKRLLKEFRSMALYTIHDCIVTTTDKLDYVEQIMREELTKYTGLRPRLKTTIWE